MLKSREELIRDLRYHTVAPGLALARFDNFSLLYAARGSEVPQYRWYVVVHDPEKGFAATVAEGRAYSIDSQAIDALFAYRDQRARALIEEGRKLADT